MVRTLSLLLAFTLLANVALAPALAQEAPLHAPGAAAAEKVTADSHGAGPEAEAQPGLLSPDLGTAVWTIVLFLVLLVVLGKFAWPKILKGLQDRENKIRTDLERAEDAARKAEATLKEYQASLAKAHEEARKIVEQSRTQAEQLAEKIKHETHAEIKAVRQRAEVEIRLAKEQAITDIYGHVATLATGVAGKILQRELNPEDQKAIVERSLAEFTPAPDN